MLKAHESKIKINILCQRAFGLLRFNQKLQNEDREIKYKLVIKSYLYQSLHKRCHLLHEVYFSYLAIFFPFLNPAVFLKFTN